MLTNFYKTVLFISSFLPLYVMLLIKFYDFGKSFSENLCDNRTVFIIFGALIIFSLLIFMYFLFCQLNHEADFGEIENVNTEILSYFITYIVPLTTLEMGDLNSILINILLFIVIGIFYVNSNQFYLNVLFTLFGFNLYRDDKGQIIISKKNTDHINNQEHVNVKKVGNKIYLINKK